MRFLVVMQGAYSETLPYGDPVVLSAAATLSLSPLLILLLLHRWLTSEVLVSQGRGG